MYDFQSNIHVYMYTAYGEEWSGVVGGGEVFAIMKSLTVPIWQ